MDIHDNNDRREGSIWAEMSLMAWLSLILPVFFIILGTGILAGIFFTNKYAAIENPIRLPAGIGLCLWGLVRIVMVFRRLNRQRGINQRG
ncbi:MAG: hypothetical protein A2W25_01530 [candidate division Zixibacteria bacterium RBG_16_53_22]|nr:MAG: hypothetical protein A2W25_01530 [candidate division Zixibacteria bacterium RBG_16_53_22]